MSLTPRTSVERYIPPDDLYKEATSFVAALKSNPSDKDAVKNLNEANDAIKKYNTENRFTENDGLIPIPEIQSNIQEYEDLKRLVEDPENIEALSKLQELCDKWNIVVKKNAFPGDWSLTLPEVPTKEIPPPKTVADLYAQADQWIFQLGNSPQEPNAVGELEKINEQITEDSKKIDINGYQASAKDLAESLQAHTQAPTQGNYDTFQLCRNKLVQFIQEHNYPNSWLPQNIDPPKRTRYELLLEAKPYIDKLFGKADDSDSFQKILEINQKIADPNGEIPISQLREAYGNGQKYMKQLIQDPYNEDFYNTYEI
ncbi:uncharacterized protein TRUGW13939_09730 [Talaromyces rugulosus]|uniref:Uncharacterized protein n=1 Tax=Talaromyces rugulosus TaxID=121627 RepID=A0A7H8R854_TALRU|nr:uncharacterized protein TRUGW13939_09730 [Talaromyces rugulosus]QKX62569.1 hypothetical protein TRUGW13939_09730 [Talaromyces rugulosus]